MSIKSTRFISLEHAIERITQIALLIQQKKYRDIENESSEHDGDVQQFVEANSSIDVSNIDNWIDTMLEDKMDEPFFRHSIFDNYLIGKGD